MQQFGGTSEILCEQACIVNRDADLGDAIRRGESPCAKQEPRYNAHATPDGFLPQEHRMHFTSRRFAAFLSLFAGLLMPSPVLAQQKNDLPHPRTLEELQKAMKDVLDREHVPGAGVALIANGDVLWCGGLRNAEPAADPARTRPPGFHRGSPTTTLARA